MATGIDIPSAWHKCAEKIVLNRRHKVLVVGESDSGKSTFCRFLAHSLAAAGETVGLIDADIGQKDIGPPACITMGMVGPNESFDRIRPIMFYFVGDVTPVRHFLPMVVGVSRLTASCPARFKVINTTGLVHGIGRTLKGFTIEALEPDVIVGIQRSMELEAILKGYRDREIVRIAPSEKAASKTPADRRRARESAWASYFAGSAELTVPMAKLVFQRSLIFNGRPVGGTDFLYCEESSEGVVAVTGRRVEAGSRTHIVRPGFEENLLCGVADRDGNVVGLGIVARIDFRNKKMRLLSPVPARAVRIIQFGDLYVSPDGRELGRRKPGEF